MTPETIDEIKHLLKYITFDFGTADIEFIDKLKYPCNITVIRQDLALDNPMRKMQFSVEDIEGVHALFKTLSYQDEPLMVQIDSETSVLSLEKEEE